MRLAELLMQLAPHAQATMMPAAPVTSATRYLPGPAPALSPGVISRAAQPTLAALLTAMGSPAAAAAQPISAQPRPQRVAATGFNHPYRVTHVGEGGATLSPGQVESIARSVGFTPVQARQMSQIAHGESGYTPGIVQRDPGDGNVGYGLTQATPHAWGKGTPAYNYMMRLGGQRALLNPVKNLQMAKFLFDRGGLSPWRGTRYLT